MRVTTVLSENIKLFTVWVIALLVSATTLAAQPSEQQANTDMALDVDTIVKKAEQVAYYSGKDGKSMARMLIVDEQGRKQMRQFTILRKDVTTDEGADTGDQRMLVFFSRPTEVQGTVFRVEKHADLNTDDDR
ncbi:MAG: outer membrane lipoprotein-sorting protein, partial [Pseudomonadota bacterium]|nr:outer membrane lipoprotein-sorting protein [Pseudomonadota bacterium]